MLVQITCMLFTIMPVSFEMLAETLTFQLQMWLIQYTLVITCKSKQIYFKDGISVLN